MVATAAMSTMTRSIPAPVERRTVCVEAEGGGTLEVAVLVSELVVTPVSVEGAEVEAMEVVEVDPFFTKSFYFCPKI